MLKRIIASQICGCRTPIIKSIRQCSTESVNPKFLTVAIIGSPNAGKSTLVNSMVGNRICAVTHIANTTRTHLNGILNIGDTQLVFTDTPGVISYAESRRLKMHQNHIRTPKRVAGSSDILAVVTDVSNRKTKNYIDEEILHIMNDNSEIPAVLIMNKIDQLYKKEELITLATLLTRDREKDEWGYKLYGGSKRFLECFFTCGLTGDGVDQFLDYLVSQAKPKPWEYSNIYCETSIETLICEVFREKLLTMFGQEIPWKVKQETTLFHTDRHGYIRIHHKLTWPKKSQRRYVATKEQELGKLCTEVLQDMFQCPVRLTIDISHKQKITTDELLYY